MIENVPIKTKRLNATSTLSLELLVLRTIFFVLITTSITGCLAKQVASDGVNVRQAILDMYTDQVMDNLIRAKTGRPFVQLAYRDILIQDVDNVSGSAGETYADTTARASNGLQVLTSLTHTISNTLPFMASAKRDRTMSFKADPITDKNDIYELYLSFAANPSLLIVTDCKPTQCVHIMREYCGKYFWIPEEASNDFLQLSLKTTFMRGPDKSQPQADYFAVTIKDMIQEKLEDGIFYGYIEFNQVIPNDEGSMIVTLADKRKIRLKVNAMTKPLPGATKPPAKGESTNQLEIEFNTKSNACTAENLKMASAKLYLQSFLPPSPPPTADLQRVNDTLEQIRLNTLNNANR